MSLKVETAEKKFMISYQDIPALPLAYKHALGCPSCCDSLITTSLQELHLLKRMIKVTLFQKCTSDMGALAIVKSKLNEKMKAISDKEKNKISSIAQHTLQQVTYRI